MKKERQAKSWSSSPLSETAKEKKETCSLPTVPLADPSLETRKKEASRPLYLTRYE